MTGEDNFLFDGGSATATPAHNRASEFSDRTDVPDIWDVYIRASCSAYKTIDGRATRVNWI